jgi:hypothetical protein
MNDWLKELKVGDEVFVMRSGWGVQGHYAKVIRLTKTLIITQKGLSKEKWRISDGGIPGGSVWSQTHLAQVTPELKNEIEVQSLSNKATALKERLPIPSSKADLEAFIAALTPFVKEAK